MGGGSSGQLSSPARPRTSSPRGLAAGSRASGAGWADPDSEFWMDGYTTDGVTSLGPCPMNCNNSNENYSFHTGGMNAAFCDGSVRYLSQSMSIVVFANITSAQGGEIPANLN